VWLNLTETPTITDKAKEALEPVFSIEDDVPFHDFRSVFRPGHDDVALVNAILLSATFAVKGAFDEECIRYQNETIKSVRQRLVESEMSSTISTLGAILLLAGVEVEDPAREILRVRHSSADALSRCVWGCDPELSFI
jgi:hypothetical protein